jgi:hypothetical protein
VGNKWLGNACVGLSFKALFALEIEDGGTYVMVGFGGILCLLHKFSPFSSIFFFFLWREFGLGEMGPAEKTRIGRNIFGA